MALVLRYGTSKNFWEGVAHKEILTAAPLNLLALNYGYKYRLDIRPKNGLPRVEFVRTLREARFIGRPIRRAKGVVRFFRLRDNGTLEPHQW
ncbi:MAG: hypothetical protein M3Y72_19835 [Acidobacteriota bacterium]|nr:hypothetical protein [Acidobacteriota bacterium]